jgi:hypothetical protein
VFPKPTSNTGKADIVDIDKSKPAGASGDATLKSCRTSVSRSVTTAEKKLYVAGWWYKDPSSVYKWSWKANSCQAPTSGASIAAPDATTGACIAATDATTLDNSNPPYGELPAGGYGVPASGGNVTGGKYVFDGKPIDVTNTGYWNSNRSCSYMTNGYLTAAAGGSWGTSITAQPGWGNGNTGGEVNPGAYTTMFTVTGMYPDDGDVGQGGEPDYTDKDCPVLGWGTHAVFCWELQATYTGHPGWNWYSLLGANTPELPNSSGFVSVYGTRDNR